MSEDTLNDKLWEAISGNLDSFEDHISGTDKAANECEKICYSEMLDLLNTVCLMYLSFDVREFEKEVAELRQSLTNKLNSLKNE